MARIRLSEDDIAGIIDMVSSLLFEYHMKLAISREL
jgi:hypothetical protein